ncbi:MAG: autotransporter domain-containing protein [Planctomycetes bacterium]|nr:autotransporter domain-containing protein [Planctomycetota bacterium]
MEDNTLIRSAEGKTDTSLEFCATTPVTVEGTTTVQVAEGQLALDGTFNGSTITKTGDGAVKLDRLNSVAGLDQFNLAAGDLTSAYDQAFKELNTGAGTAIDLGANGLTVEQGKMQGTATIESLTKNGTGTFDIDQQLTMNGALTVTDGELRVHVQEGQPSIIADSMNFGSSTQLRISGYTSGTTDRTEVDIIQTNNIIDPGELPSNIQIDGTVTQMYNFLKTDGRLSADKETLVVGLALNWYDTNQDGQQRYTDAHGNYKLDGFDFELGTQLNDRTPGLVFIKDWDGTKLTKEGDGILTLNADNTYSGGSHIMEGALRAVRSASLGIGKVDIESGARLLLDFNGIFKNDIAGGGTIESMGNVFIDDCLADFTGNIMVSSGELRLGMDGGSCDASGAIDFHVASGGRMGGLGTTGDLRVAGVIAPGHSIGTIDVNGNLAFDTGAVYEVEVDPNSNQQADLIAVTGSANLTGATVHHIGLGEVAEYGPEGEWLILTAANGLGGTRFAGPETEYLFLDQRLDYRDADTSVYLILQGNDRALDDFVLTPNQNAVANALQSMAAAPGSLYNSILALPADTDINDVYDQLSGETHSSLRGLLRDYDAGFGRAMLTRSLYPTPADCAFPLWASFGGSALHKRGNDNYAKAKLDSYDVTVGGEGRLAGGWLVGGAFRYGNSDMKVDDRHAKSDIDSYSFGVYGGKETPFFAGVLRWSTGVSYGYHDVEARRNITVPTLTQTLRADYHAQTFQAVGDLGFRFNNSAVAFFEPFVRLGWHSAWTNSFEESGGNAALRAEKEHRGNLSHHLGVRASGRLGDVVSVNASAAWIHSYGSKNNSTNFAFSQGGDTFTIDGVTVTRDAAHLTAGVGANVTEKLTLGLTYEGIVSNRFQNHGGRIFAQYCF